MGLKELQDGVDEWTSHFETPYWQPHEILARLIEETGEPGREINHLNTPKRKRMPNNYAVLSG